MSFNKPKQFILKLIVSVLLDVLGLESMETAPFSESRCYPGCVCVRQSVSPLDDEPGLKKATKLWSWSWWRGFGLSV